MPREGTLATMKKFFSFEKEISIASRLFSKSKVSSYVFPVRCHFWFVYMRYMSRIEVRENLWLG